MSQTIDISKDKFEEFVNRGMTRKQMAAETGYSYASIVKYLKKYGLSELTTAEPNRKKKGITREQIEEALEYCYTASELAEHFRLHISTVRQLLWDYNLKPRDYKAKKKFRGTTEEENLLPLANCKFATRDTSTSVVVRNGKRYRDITNLIIQ